MNQDLTFLVISSANDLTVEDTIKSIVSTARILIVDGGPRRNQSYKSLSEINLLELAEKYNCIYLARKYDYYASQCNYGLSQIKTEWAFVIDSDETISDELADWLKEGRFLKHNQFKVKRFNYFLGKKMFHGQFRPDWNVRLIKPEFAKYEDRQVHPRIHCVGKISKAPGHMNHFTVTNLDNFFAKMLEFSSLEPASRLSSSHSNEFKAQIRCYLQKLPFQAFLRFCYSYFWRLGFLDGKIGFLLAKSASYYEDLVSLRKIESER